MKKIVFKNFEDLKKSAKKQKGNIAQAIKEYESSQTGKSIKEIESKMQQMLEAMRESIAKGLKKKNISHTKLTNSGAFLLKKQTQKGFSLVNKELSEIIYKILAVSELNACMGKIVTAPTAGACGVIPGVLLAIADKKQIQEKKVIDALFVAAAIGEVIASQASIAGAIHGCQAETGTASAMLAAALVYMFDSDIVKIESAAVFALSNMLGLVCDPVGGYVEIPCIRRNVMAGLNGIAATEMALAGIKYIIPFDEVIVAMDKIGKKMDPDLKETAKGGLANTKTGRKYIRN